MVKDNALPANTNQALAIIRLKSDTWIARKFLLTYLKSSDIREHIEAINVRAAQANLSLENVYNFKIVTPALAEQHAIATVLSDMDAEIAALDTRFAKTQAIKQGIETSRNYLRRNALLSSAQVIYATRPEKQALTQKLNALRVHTSSYTNLTALKCTLKSTSRR